MSYLQVEKYITAEQLSQIIQYSKRTIYEWVCIDFIPHYKLPKGIRFKITEIEAWMKKKRKKGRLHFKLEI
jgi:excisionase family DNA binding protein